MQKGKEKKPARASGRRQSQRRRKAAPFLSIQVRIGKPRHLEEEPPHLHVLLRRLCEMGQRKAHQKWQWGCAPPLPKDTGRHCETSASRERVRAPRWQHGQAALAGRVGRPRRRSVLRAARCVPAAWPRPRSRLRGFYLMSCIKDVPTLRGDNYTEWRKKVDFAFVCAEVDWVVDTPQPIDTSSSYR
ncbi:hypothetical protein QYE76_015266 [Lolium multiflorum]|uniref:Uncharacterized protein n=1 Tax=Lolium multiflorum TaxID=4521 RepID=A0AAD8X9P4_LOLMU|nr:hypothetical protein QYE76_015266 [Lolium multiflorum]